MASHTKSLQAYIYRVIHGQPICTEDSPALQKFLIFLASCRNMLKEIGFLNRLENPEGLRKIVDWLPYPLKLKWRELVDTIIQNQARDPNLMDVTEWPTILFSARFKVNRADPAVTITATDQKGLQGNLQWKVSWSHPVCHQAIRGRRKYWSVPCATSHWLLQRL